MSDDYSYENETFDEEEVEIPLPAKPKQSTRPIIMNVSDTQYPIVKYVGNVIMEWKLQYESDGSDWDVWWTDLAVSPETLSKMRSHQKINHFPGMYVLARKNFLGKILMKMRKRFPQDYNFFPKTWVLPAENSDLKAYNQKSKNKTYIVKPEASCQGRGIFLTKTLDWINNHDRFVVQRYKAKPFLIDGLKFDLRVYVLVAGCDPLRIYIYTEGLARFATEEYQPPTNSNIGNTFMHLTNYAINKLSDKFVFNNDEQDQNVGHKRSLSSVFELMKSNGHDIDTLWMRIKDIVIKTLCAGQPLLKHQYQSCQPSNLSNNMCFEILGFDIFITDKFKPILLEVNHTPSFNTDTPLDTYIKQNLIQDTLILMNITPETRQMEMKEKQDELNKRMLTGKNNRMNFEERQQKISDLQLKRDFHEDNNLGGYEKIYPAEKEYEDEYYKFIKQAQQIQEDQTGTGMSLRRAPMKRLPEKVDLPNNYKQRCEDLSKIYSQMTSKTLKGTYANTQRANYSPQVKVMNSSQQKINNSDLMGEDFKPKKSGILYEEESRAHGFSSSGNVSRNPQTESNFIMGVNGTTLQKLIEGHKVQTSQFELIYKDLINQQIHQEQNKIKSLVQQKKQFQTPPSSSKKTENPVSKNIQHLQKIYGERSIKTPETPKQKKTNNDVFEVPFLPVSTNYFQDKRKGKQTVHNMQSSINLINRMNGQQRTGMNNTSFEINRSRDTQKKSATIFQRTDLLPSTFYGYSKYQFKNNDGQKIY